MNLLTRTEQSNRMIAYIIEHPEKSVRELVKFFRRNYLIVYTWKLKAEKIKG